MSALVSAPVPSFADFCRVWPMRSEAERAEAQIAFADLSDDKRARAVAGAEVLAWLIEEVGIERESAAHVIRRGLDRWAEFARMTPNYRELMRQGTA